MNKLRQRSFSGEKPSVAKLVLASCGVLFILGVAYFMLKGDPTPDRALLEKRTRAAIELGWGWLGAENMQVRNLECSGNRCNVTFSYTVVVKAEETTLDQAEKSRFRTYLPMCEKIPLNKGSRCELEESITYIDTPEYGWMPEAFVQHQPAMLLKIDQMAQ